MKAACALCAHKLEAFLQPIFSLWTPLIVVCSLRCCSNLSRALVRAAKTPVRSSCAIRRAKAALTIFSSGVTLIVAPASISQMREREQILLRQRSSSPLLTRRKKSSQARALVQAARYCQHKYGRKQTACRIFCVFEQKCFNR